MGLVLLAMAVAVVSSPVEKELVGTWGVEGEALWRLSADNTCQAPGARSCFWSADSVSLQVRFPSGEIWRMPFVIAGDSLMVEAGGHSIVSMNRLGDDASLPAKPKHAFAPPESKGSSLSSVPLPPVVVAPLPSVPVAEVAKPLIGAWGVSGHGLLLLNADGTCLDGSGPCQWNADGKQMELTSSQGRKSSLPYHFEGPTLKLQAKPGVIFSLEPLPTGTRPEPNDDLRGMVEAH
jgi:hypothetical protein